MGCPVDCARAPVGSRSSLKGSPGSGRRRRQRVSRPYDQIIVNIVYEDFEINSTAVLDRTRGALANAMGAALKDIYCDYRSRSDYRPSFLGEATVSGGYKLMETS